MTTRRLFLAGAASLIAAPAIVHAESLMRVVMPRPLAHQSSQWLINWADATDEIYPGQNRFEAYTTWARYDGDIVAEDWRYASRILPPPEAVSFVPQSEGMIDMAALIAQSYRDLFKAIA